MKKIISLVFAVLIAVSAFNITIVSAAENTFAVVATDDTQNDSEPSETPAESSSETTESSETTSATEASENTTATENSSETAETQATTESAESTEPSATESIAPSETVEPTEATEATEATESTTMPPVIKPQTVTDLKITEQTSSSATFSWTKSENTQRYVVYRAEENHSAGTKFTYKLFKTIKNENKTTFTDKKLKSGTVYKYKIVSERTDKAYNKIRKSKAAKISLCTSLDTPKNFKVADTTSTTVTLKWSSVRGASKYEVYRKSETSSKFNLIGVISNTTLLDKGRTSGKIYKYKVNAKRSFEGKEMRSPQVTVKAVTKLAATSSIKVKKATTSKIVLDWKKILNAKKYQIYRKSENATEYTHIATTDKTNFADTKFVAGLDYTYMIRGYRYIDGVCHYSPFKSIKATAGVVGVGNVKILKNIAGKALLSWTAVDKAEGYDIFIQGGNGKDIYKGTTKTTMYHTEKHQADKSYIYKVKSYRYINGKKSYGTAKSVKVRIVGTAYGKSVGQNYLEVCRDTQTVYMYIDGKLYAQTPVVTGYYKVYDTTAGYHYIISRKSPARLKGSAGNDSWDLEVNYWLGFTYDGQGFHDSTWRTSGYGGTIYKGDGSHGCVNTPLTAMSKIYKKAYVGMPVIVY